MSHHPAKKVKLSQNTVLNDLASIRLQIKNIKSGKIGKIEKKMPKSEVVEDDDPTDDERNFLIESSEKIEPAEETSLVTKKNLLSAENRIHRRIDALEVKIDKILDMLLTQNPQVSYEVLESENMTNESQEEEQHILESLELEKVVDEYQFPINEEEHFEWFQANLSNDTYRANLVDKRSYLVKGLSFKTLMVAVKQFLLHHFELEVCTKYSCSGYGSHGSKKKKLNSKLIGLFVFESFTRENVENISYADIMKCVVQFFGRAPDMYNKKLNRDLKQESDSQQ